MWAGCMYKQYFGLFNSKNEVKNQGTDGVLGKCMYDKLKC